MSEQKDIYGEETSFGGSPIEVSKEQVAEKRDTFPLRIYFTGGSVILCHRCLRSNSW